MSKYWLLGFWVFGISSLRADNIKLAADPWCPFTCKPGSSSPGVLVEVAQHVLATYKHSLSYESVAWARALVETREKKFHAVAGALKTDAPDFVFPTVSWVSQKSCFYVKKGNPWTFMGAGSLKNKKLGAVKDYTYGDPLDAYIKENSKAVEFVSGTNTSLKLLKKLLDKRNEVIVEDESVVAFTLKNAPNLAASEVIKAGCLEEAPLYIAFGPNDPNSKLYAQQLSEGYNKLKKTKSLQDIFKKYGMESK